MKLRTCWKEAKAPGLSFVQNATQGKQIEAPASHVHIMKAVYFHKPTWCDVCGWMCRLHGHQCVECRFRTHTKCTEGLPNCVLQSTGASSSLARTGLTVDAGLAVRLGMEIPTPPAMGESINVAARTLDGTEIRVSISSTETVLALKKKLLAEMKSPQPASRLSLVFGGAPLKSAADLLTLAAVGLDNGSTVNAIFYDDEDAGPGNDITALDLLELNTTGLFDSPRG